MATVEPIRVDGLRDFQAALKAGEDGAQKALRLVLNDGADIVVQGARRQVPRRSGRARGSLKAQSSQRLVRVKGGGARAPHYPWLDFGGRVGRARSVHRPFLREGRYIYRSYYDRRPEILRILGLGLERLARDAGFEVH